MSKPEDDLDKVFSDIIFLVYKNKCIWHNHSNEVPCGGVLETSHLIPRKDKYFRWDLNNAVVMCDNHHKWWHGTFKASQSQNDAYNFLLQSHPRLVDFMVDNTNAKHQYKPDFEALRTFLLEHANEAIKKGEAPFASLYGKFNE